ncbi:hypothetical protein C5708_12725 [Caulobacter sp. CCUG 60055]|nr:hypothetical protein [Caulobacter sp. CCUG 60055]
MDVHRLDRRRRVDGFAHGLQARHRASGRGAVGHRGGGVAALHRPGRRPGDGLQGDRRDAVGPRRRRGRPGHGRPVPHRSDSRRRAFTGRFAGRHPGPHPDQALRSSQAGGQAAATSPVWRRMRQKRTVRRADSRGRLE